jgi:hypothetical protein
MQTPNNQGSHSNVPNQGPCQQPAHTLAFFQVELTELRNVGLVVNISPTPKRTNHGFVQIPNLVVVDGEQDVAVTG